MFDNEIRINAFLLGYCRMLVRDISEAQMTDQPLPGVNHPAWILGHLAFSADRARALLGLQTALPAEWVPLFSPGSKASRSRGDYPPKEELLRLLEQGFQDVRQKAPTATPEQLSQPITNPRMREAFPTAREMIAFWLTGHLGIHLGQLSAWRRMIGLPAMF